MCDLWRISGTTAIPLTVCCYLLAVAVGYPIFGDFIPNGHRVPDPCRRDTVWDPVGHQGFLKRSPLNAFGVDFARSRVSVYLCSLQSSLFFSSAFIPVFPSSFFRLPYFLPSFLNTQLSSLIPCGKKEGRKAGKILYSFFHYSIRSFV